MDNKNYLWVEKYRPCNLDDISAQSNIIQSLRSVITTKNTPWKTLEDNACGWWVDMNINALYSALDQAISLSDVERENMGKRGFELSQKYDNGLLSKKILLEYLRLLR